MIRISRCSAIAAALAALASAALAAQTASPFVDGRWSGTVELRAAAAPDTAVPAPEAVAPEAAAAPAVERLGLRLFSADSASGIPAGGLVDMPSRGLFGYPMGDLRRDSGSLCFSLRGGAPFDGRFELRLAGPGTAANAAGTAAAGGEVGGSDGAVVSGELRIFSAGSEAGEEVIAEGVFSLARESESARPLEYGLDYPIDTGRGVLPGSLLVPELDSPAPVVLILSGAQADRDGNNYAVPGASDSLLQLALSLRGRGVATLRFDKRGCGEAYVLAPEEGELLFDDHIDDARAALRALAADRRFSSITVAGFAEGALVGASALALMPDSAFAGAGAAAREGAAGPGAAVPVSGIVALCASGKTEAEAVEEALASAPEELREEAAAIMSALRSGGRWPDPSPYFADYFRPSAQPYLASLFARNIRDAFAAASARSAALVVAGGSDLQVAPAESELLAASAAGAELRTVPGMSHALKGVGDDEELNYASFTDPSIPLAEGLVDLLAAFAKRAPLPEEPRGEAASSPAAEEGSAALDAAEGGEGLDDGLAGQDEVGDEQ
jgi:alpha/beta superfamily hydrolase